MDDSLGPFNLVLLALPGLALVIAVRVMYGRRSPAAADPMQMLLSQAGRILLALAALGGAIGLVGLWWLLIPVPIVLGVATFMAIDRYRHGEHRALVWTLASAAGHGIPLAEAARAYADETQGDTGARATTLARALEQGTSLSQAIQLARLRVSTPVRLAIRLGELLGMLGPAMRQQMEDAAEVDAALRSVVGRLFYLGNVVVIASGVFMYVVLTTAPKLAQIYDDFGLKLPIVTERFLLINYDTQPLAVIVFLPLILAMILFLLAGVLYFLGWFPRDLPLVWRLFRRYDGALVLRGLALTVRRGLPLVDGLKALYAVYPIGHITRTLFQVIGRVEQGGDWRQALVDAGLIGRADAAVLASAERAGNLVWALEEMADSALRRLVYRLQAGVQLLFPLAIVAIAILAGSFVIAVFLPLIALIQGLA